MSWIFLEGLDRSGKSSVADYYKKQGYKVIHMSAPDKKYFNPSYAGESYLEELVRLYSIHDGQNVVFDRTCYGELVWPNVYNRLAMLNEEDIEYLASIERNNDTQKILMFDSNTEAHWQRCVDNNEPLTRQQFGRANLFYERLVKDYGFKKQQLSDVEGFEHLSKKNNGTVKSNNSIQEDLSKSNDNISVTTSSDNSSTKEARNSSNDKTSASLLSVEDRLERANAIRGILQSQILRKKGGAYDDIESSIREFLQIQLDGLFKEQENKSNGFSEDEIKILKLYAQRIIQQVNK